jgi:hypothetical protein
MPILSTITTNVLAHLEREAGTTEYWETTEIDGVVNFLYKLLAFDYRNIKEVYTRDSVDVVGKIYAIPENLLAIEEITFDGKSVDPKSIYEIKLMDDQWRTRLGTPDWYCLDYREGYVLLWYFPSTIAEIKIFGPIQPDTLTSPDIPAAPYSNGQILEPGVVSFSLAKEGGGQNLERSNYWYDIYLGALSSFNLSKHPSMDHVLRSIDTPRGQNFGPRLPQNYPAINWFGR